MEETSFILEIAYQWSYLGIFGIAFIANAFPGIPEEVFILALGYLGSTPSFSMFWVGLLAFLGMFASDCIIFGISRGGARFYHKIAEKILGDDMDKLKESSFAQRHIRKIIFFSRFIVQVRFLGPFLAGVYKTSWKTFLTFNTLALLVYVPVALFLGSYFQGRIVQILSGTSVMRNYMMILVVVVLVFIVVRAIRKGFIKRLIEADHFGRAKNFLGFSKIEKEEEEGK
jgi:membrane protein DedA with SNARE-associated domain